MKEILTQDPEYIMREIKFTKMHGTGNDYVYIDTFSQPLPYDISKLAICMSERHRGIGGDGIVLIMPSDKVDFRMRMFNADGSEAQMCGNASRCIGKYVYDFGLTRKTTVTLETLAGIKVLDLHIGETGNIDSVTVDMGEPILEAAKVPVNTADPSCPCVAMPVKIEDEDYLMTAVSMGNPHGVIFVDDITDHHIFDIGKAFEIDALWPEKANVEFAKVINRHEIRMRVWERGTGETMACGTGACATAVAAILNGFTDREVDIHLQGGTLHICWDEQTGHVYMRGGATTVASGVYYPDSAQDNNLIDFTI